MKGGTQLQPSDPSWDQKPPLFDYDCNRGSSEPRSSPINRGMKLMLHCTCDHLFSYKIFRDGRLKSETYGQTLDDLVEKFPNLTLSQLNSLDTNRPVEHNEGNEYYEIKIEKLARDKSQADITGVPIRE